MTADPDWTLEEAWQANQKTLDENPDRPWTDPTLPFSQWCGLKELEAARSKYERGNKFELMRAIQICATHELVLPEWASKAYIYAYMKIVRAREKSWDSVFGAPYPKGTHLHAIRKKLSLQYAVWNEIRGIQDASLDVPIDETLFEDVGKKFNLGKTLASEYYYEVAKRMKRK